MAESVSSVPDEEKALGRGGRVGEDDAREEYACQRDSDCCSKGEEGCLVEEVGREGACGGHFGRG